MKSKSIMNLLAMKYMETRLAVSEIFSFSMKYNSCIMKLSILIMVSYEIRKYSFKSLGRKNLISNRK